ncbi:phage virion morphogenesis protein [Bosea sp. 685]|uniref:phage virion morphogenesis protein n=1 Tax=Bosea sp. 685 TaxID=3080057 RepID=UPI0028929E64|nr:phage virion morphogenesis protein [Bosea sp. 685]WNJ89161.1 phage virion morphogenesis protein [Bosea sp. 685]
MTGVVLNTRMDISEAQAGFARLGAVMADTRPVMRAIGTGLVTSTQDRFDAGHDPDGAAWKPLNPVYAAGKRGPGILRERGMRGGLQGSITYRAGSSEVQVGTNKIYGAIQHFGGTILPKGGGRLVFKMGNRVVHARSVTLPPRPYLGISSSDQVMILDVVEGALARAVTSGSSSVTRRR